MKWLRKLFKKSDPVDKLPNSIVSSMPVGIKMGYNQNGRVVWIIPVGNRSRSQSIQMISQLIAKYKFPLPSDRINTIKNIKNNLQEIRNQNPNFDITETIK